jgi:photosystem II stability/assembly factor-like uncharacterized protein
MKKILILSLTAVALISVITVYVSNQRNFKTQPLFQEMPETKEPKMYPNDWMSKQKLYPNGKFSYQHYLYSLEQAKTVHKAAAYRNAEWTQSGPTNIGGRITDIAIHPDQSNTWYIGAATGGIHKTTDAGQTWQHVFTDVPVISIGALAIDPVDPDILYAGTGEANSSSQSFIGNGIYKTVDGGETWQHLGLEQSAYFGRIIIDYSNTNRIFAAATGTLFGPNETRGIYRSTDGGEQWERVLFVTDSTAGIDIVQHPSNPEILYAAMWERSRGLTYRRSHGASSGIYKSTDGGDSWNLLTNGLPTGDTKGRIGLAVAQNNPEIVYAFIDAKEGSSSYASVYKSTNGGTTWQRTNDGGIYSMNSSFGWYFGQIRVDPSNDNRFWVLGVELHRSDDGGNSYEILAGYHNLNDIYVDQHALFIHPTTGFLVHGNDGGLYTSSNFGDSWTKINNLPLTQFYAIEVDYLNPHRIYGGTQDNNSIRTYTGATDEWERILGGDGFYSLVDYTNSDYIYAEYQWGNLFRSTDGGQNFNSIVGWYGDRTNWSSPYVLHPTTPTTLYFGTYRVWKSENMGNSWTAISSDLTRSMATSGFSTISTIAISSLNPQLLLAGSDDGLVHLSINGGGNWENISEGLPNRWITRVAFDPFDENTIYATVSGFRWNEAHAYVFKSNDLGQNWMEIGSNLPELPVNVIVADPEVQNRLIVGTDVGVFITDDSGENWYSLMTGMPNVPIYDMKIHNPTRTLVAGTYGCSSFKLNLDAIVGLKENNLSTTKNVLLQAVYPNPVHSKQQTVVIEYYLPGKCEYSLRLLDIHGKQVAIIVEQQIASGPQRILWNLPANKAFSTGIYFLSLETSGGRSTQKIVVH